MILLLLVLLDRTRGENGSPYCSFTPLHTLCANAGTGPDCGNQVVSVVVRPEEAAFIVAEHNRLRSRVATGQERRGSPGPQPPAANMMLMEWDEELARVAQSHADQCIFMHECSACRRVSRFGVGQNLFTSAQIKRDNTIEWSVVINTWYNEVDIFNSNHIRPYQYTPATGHYTQMIWYNSYTIGCGFTMYKQGSWWRKLYTCDYGPGGNIIFSQVYLPGGPCSSCPPGTSCSLQYPGLCGYATTFVVPSRTLKGQSESIPDPDSENISQVEAAKLTRPTSNITESQMAEWNLSAPSQTVGKVQQASNVSHKPEDPSTGDGQELCLLTCLFGNRPAFYRFCWLTEWYFSLMHPLPPFVNIITPKPARGPDVIVRCDADSQPCEFKSLSPSWIVQGNHGRGSHVRAVLEVGEEARFMYHKRMAAPSGKITCVSVSHLLSFEDIVYPSATVTEFMVVVRQQRGEAITVNFGGTPGRWEETSMSINSIRSPYIVELFIGPVNYRVTVAIGALYVTGGLC
ncbi:uncharacterized protein LOC135202017 [Macrobrachium nipponense]|uniref:uncharacterized protein LOC135202017 n=1 Tax=Macrobrachium nipponense TaxID=159736 RepID=UPI0030C8CFF1